MEDCFGQFGRLRAGPWLAHRLDRDTAGCLVIALRRAALLEAQRCFAEGRAEKTYWAAVRNRPVETTGELHQRIGRVERAGTWRMAPAADGALAVTRWRLLGTSTAGISWLELTPMTGRTHQIRLACATLGCPILGDPVYGPQGPTHALHLLARSIRLPLEPPVAAEAGVPDHMIRAYNGLRQEGQGSALEPPRGGHPSDPRREQA